MKPNHSKLLLNMVHLLLVLALAGGLGAILYIAYGFLQEVQESGPSGIRLLPSSSGAPTRGPGHTLSRRNIDPELSALPDLPSTTSLPDSGSQRVQQQERPGSEAVSPTPPERDPADLTPTNAVWQIGRFNGRPEGRNDWDVSDEFGMRSAPGSVHHVYRVDECPAFVEPGQTLVLHLPPLPSGLFELNVATTGEMTPPTVFREFAYADFLSNRMRIRWNDRLVSQRWYPPLSYITEVLIFPDWLARSGENLVALENPGDKSIPLDAVWIAPHRQGLHPFYCELEEGHWLNRKESSWVRNVSVSVPLPPDRPEIRAPVLSPADLRPPASRRDLLANWPIAMRRLQALADRNVAELGSLRVWHNKLQKAARREMMISVELPTRITNPPALETAAYAFGDLIHTWYIPAQNPPDAVTEAILRHVPDARIVPPSSSGMPPRHISRLSWQRGSVSPSWLIPIMEQGQVFRAFFSPPFTSNPPPPPWTVRRLRPPSTAYRQEKHGVDSDDLLGAAAEFLMASDAALRVSAAHPGSPFFPAADGRPSLLWNAIKPLFRFAGPDHRKTLINLVPGNPNVFLRDTYWAAAGNGTDSVHVLIRNRISYNGQDVRIDVPVPWTGATLAVEHALPSSWDQAPGANRPTGTRLAATPLSTGIGSPKRGRVTLPLTLAGFQVIELYPGDENPPHRTIRAPQRIGFAHVRDQDGLFQVVETPLPVWWARKKACAAVRSLWAGSGKTEISVPVRATRGNITDWAPRRHSTLKRKAEFIDLVPLYEESVHLRFDEEEGGIAQVGRASYYASSIQDAELLGLWIRLNCPEAVAAPTPGVRQPTSARFFMGNSRIRQQMDLKLNTWLLAVSDIQYWKEGRSEQRPGICFWPDPTESTAFELEVNAIEAFRRKTPDGTPLNPADLFTAENESGNVSLLIIGRSGKPARVSQRFSRAIDAAKLNRIVDRALLVSADSPEDRPPELVPCAIKYFSAAQLLSVFVPEMPPPPSISFRSEIAETFPVVANRLDSPETGAVLFTLNHDVSAP